MSAILKPSELVLNQDGSIYHLHLLPEDVGDKIILVGDPGRVDRVSAQFDTLEVQKAHREFITHTGTYRDKRISVISTGIGTDNMDIVVNELDILSSVNLEQRVFLETPKKLRFVRLGTCGILQENIPVGAFLQSTFAIGFDSLMQFYPYKENYDEHQLHGKVDDHFKEHGIDLPFYVSQSHGEFAFDVPDRHRGITVTLPGFYGPQGRNLRGGTKFNDFLNMLRTLQAEDMQVVNFEMECSGLFGLANLLGHESITVCVGLANRVTGQFIKDATERIDKLIFDTLEVI